VAKGGARTVAIKRKDSAISGNKSNGGKITTGKMGHAATAGRNNVGGFKSLNMKKG